MSDDFDLTPQLLLQGNSFSPSRVAEASGLTFRLSHERGEMATTGRYRGQPYAFGSALLEPPGAANYSTRIDWMFAVLDAHLPTFHECGADHIVLHLCVGYGNQCNLEFTVAQLRALGQFEIPLTIECFKLD